MGHNTYALATKWSPWLGLFASSCFLQSLHYLNQEQEAPQNVRLLSSRDAWHSKAALVLCSIFWGHSYSSCLEQQLSAHDDPWENWRQYTHWGVHPKASFWKNHEIKNLSIPYFCQAQQLWTTFSDILSPSPQSFHTANPKPSFPSFPSNPFEENVSQSALFGCFTALELLSMGTLPTPGQLPRAIQKTHTHQGCLLVAGGGGKTTGEREAWDAVLRDLNFSKVTQIQTFWIRRGGKNQSKLKYLKWLESSYICWSSANNRYKVTFTNAVAEFQRMFISTKHWRVWGVRASLFSDDQD